MWCKTAKGTKVEVTFVEDVEPNKGGYYCEVEIGHKPYYDNFCIHPEDCDCSNMDEVEKEARRIVSEIKEY